MFPKNEKHRFSVSDIFSTLLRPCFFQWSKTVCVNFHRPTYQEFTPTSNIALLILCSRQAIVPLCRPGGVRAARFNKNNSKLWVHRKMINVGCLTFHINPIQVNDFEKLLEGATCFSLCKVACKSKPLGRPGGGLGRFYYPGTTRELPGIWAGCVGVPGLTQ